MKKDKKTDSSAAIIVTIVLLLLSALASAVQGEKSAFMPLLLVVAAGLIVRVIKGSKSSPNKKTKPSHEMNTAAFTTGTESENPIKCTCSQGRQRYLDQAELFYKNGIIDKEEYRVMRERYMKLDIPEDI